MAWRFKASKYKNAAPIVPKPESCIRDISVGSYQTYGNNIAASAAFMAFNVDHNGSANYVLARQFGQPVACTLARTHACQSGRTLTRSGSSLAVLPIDDCGRKSKTMPLLHAHTDTVTDMDFSPFHDGLLATGSQDCLVKLWHIPEKGLEESLCIAECTFSHKQRRVETVCFHPTADGLLTSTSFTTLTLWDISTEKELYWVGANTEHSEVIQSLSWKKDGTLMATSCKDKQVRILDPRSSNFTHVANSHQSIKDSRVIWLGDTNRILSTGFNSGRQREVYIRDLRNFEECEKSLVLDSSTGILIPLYDADTGMLFLAGKGDTTISYLEVTDREPYLIEGIRHNGEQTKGACLVPKRALTVMQGEVNRLLQLTSTSVIPIGYQVPRKTYRDFHADLFPDTTGCEAQLSASQWFEGHNTSVPRISLDPTKRASGEASIQVHRGSLSDMKAQLQNKPYTIQQKGRAKIENITKFKAEECTNEINKEEIKCKDENGLHENGDFGKNYHESGGNQQTVVVVVPPKPLPRASRAGSLSESEDVAMAATLPRPVARPRTTSTPPAVTSVNPALPISGGYKQPRLGPKPFTPPKLNFGSSAIDGDLKGTTEFSFDKVFSVPPVPGQETNGMSNIRESITSISSDFNLDNQNVNYFDNRSINRVNDIITQVPEKIDLPSSPVDGSEYQDNEAEIGKEGQQNSAKLETESFEENTVPDSPPSHSKLKTQSTAERRKLYEKRISSMANEQDTVVDGADLTKMDDSSDDKLEDFERASVQRTSIAERRRLYESRSVSVQDPAAVDKRSPTVSPTPLRRRDSFKTPKTPVSDSVKEEGSKRPPIPPHKQETQQTPPPKVVAPEPVTTPTPKRTSTVFGRVSKFRHLKGTPLHKSTHIENIRNVSRQISGECDGFHANPERVAVPLSGPGGKIAVFELSKSGKLPDGVIPTLVHGTNIMDFVWDPFNFNRLAKKDCFGSSILSLFGWLTTRLHTTYTSRLDLFPTKLRDRGLTSASRCASPKEKQETIDMRRSMRADKACDDGTIRLWLIPESGLSEPTNTPQVVLAGHSEKIYLIKFHPLAKDVLASASYDMTVRIWDLATKTEKIILQGHTDQMFSLAWSPCGNFCATVCKDTKLRIYKPRSSTQPVREGKGPVGSRGARVVWALEGNFIVVIGFDKVSERQIQVLKADNLSTSLNTVGLDVSPAILIPFYDEDSSTLFLTGKGDSTIYAFEITEEAPYICPLSHHRCVTLHQGLSFLPKNVCDVGSVEFARALRLTNNTIEPLSFTVPRIKSDLFQDDIFPPTKVTWQPTMTSEQWFSGLNNQPHRVSLKPEGMDNCTFIFLLYQARRDRKVSDAQASSQLVGGDKGQITKPGGVPLVGAQQQQPYNRLGWNPDVSGFTKEKQEQIQRAVSSRMEVNLKLEQDDMEGVDEREWED
uniref:Coronin n=1 Tax=Timema monikensis TaxID=170555 RepID=A0A7R9EAJ2_9NEOP|nr:unnamed protein product [Timema monikensis]